jgi:hypothetical protein
LLLFSIINSIPTPKPLAGVPVVSRIILNGYKIVFPVALVFKISNPVNVPTDVILVCAAVPIVPYKFVAVKLLNEEISLFASTTTPFDAVTVPGVIPVS